MKYRLPQGCHGVVFDGKVLSIAADDTIDADASAAPALEAHGIVRADEPVTEPSQDKPRRGKSP